MAKKPRKQALSARLCGGALGSKLTGTALWSRVHQIKPVIHMQHQLGGTGWNRRTSADRSRKGPPGEEGKEGSEY